MLTSRRGEIHGKAFQRKLAILAQVDCNQKFITGSRFSIHFGLSPASPRDAGLRYGCPQFSPAERPIQPWAQNLLDRAVLPIL